MNKFEFDIAIDNDLDIDYSSMDVMDFLNDLGLKELNDLADAIDLDFE